MYVTYNNTHLIEIVNKTLDCWRVGVKVDD